MKHFKSLLFIGVLAVALCGCGRGGMAVKAGNYSDFNILKKNLPDDERLKFTEKLKCGWNLGNTFDATDDSGNADPAGLESAWVGIKTSEDMIKAVHKAGFETLRLPVSWHNHVSGDDYTIDKAWLDRVQEVVDYAINDGMYVILNIHHDEQEFFPSSDRMDSSRKYVSSIWSQIAERFKSYNEHLIFETLNEPRLVGSPNEWNLNMGAKECLDSVRCINELNQLAVDTIRKTGNNNADRYIMAPGYCASPDGALDGNFVLPDDPADHMIVSVHSYAPYEFALKPDSEEGTTDAFSHSKSSDTAPVKDVAEKLYVKFISKGIPVVVGEYGSVERNGNTEARVDHAGYFNAKYRSCGIPCCWWDNYISSGNGERFGIFDRKELTFNAPEILEAIIKYSNAK